MSLGIWGKTFVVTTVSSALLAACGGRPKPPVVTALTMSSKCPNMAKADEVAAFDFATEYRLSGEAADKIKAAALASIEISALSDKLDAELGIACAQIAHDLGDGGDWRSGNDACAAAIKAVHEARGRLGPRVSAELVVGTPACLVDAGLMTKCASICDSSVPAERIKADCTLKAGRCDGDCSGACHATGASKCDGTCSGVCEGPAKGKCAGRCKGKCDGHTVNGPCAGTCLGTCDKAAFSGECRAGCVGTCVLAKTGSCESSCIGSCSVDLSQARCSGEFKTPAVSTDCRARCELAVMNQTECTTPQVGLVLTPTKDHEASDLFKAAVDKAFPGLLKILFEVGENGPKRIVNAQAVIEGARTGFREMARSGGAATATASEAQLAKCFDEPFKNAITSARAAKTGLDQAMGVREEVRK